MSPIRADIVLFLICCILCAAINLMTWVRIGSMRDAVLASVAADRIQTSCGGHVIITIRSTDESYDAFILRHLSDIQLFSQQSIK